MTKIAERILARLDVTRRTGHGALAHCPAHQDRRASLSVSEGEDGRVLLKCHAGCETEDVLAAIGFVMRDLYPKRQGAGRSNPRRRAATVQPDGGGCTLLQYAATKRLPEDFLKALGLRDGRPYRAPAVVIPYFDCGGEEIAVRYRVALEKGSEADQRFMWRRGSRTMPYGLWRLEKATGSAPLILVEGESDAQTCWHLGLAALGIPGAATWRDEWAQYLVGFPIVYVIVEPRPRR